MHSSARRVGRPYSLKLKLIPKTHALGAIGCGVRGAHDAVQHHEHALAALAGPLCQGIAVVAAVLEAETILAAAVGLARMQLTVCNAPKQLASGITNRNQHMYRPVIAETVMTRPSHMCNFAGGPYSCGTFLTCMKPLVTHLGTANAGLPPGETAVSAKGLAAPLPVLLVRCWPPNHITYASWRPELRLRTGLPTSFGGFPLAAELWQHTTEQTAERHCHNDARCLPAVYMMSWPACSTRSNSGSGTLAKKGSECRICSAKRSGFVTTVGMPEPRAPTTEQGCCQQGGTVCIISRLGALCCCLSW